MSGHSMEPMDVQELELESIQFKLLSPDDILNASFCEVPKWDDQKEEWAINLFDPRLGVTKNNEACHTCGRDVVG